MDRFKNDIVDRANQVKDIEKRDAETDGYMAKSDLYLSMEEYKEYKNYVDKFRKDHSVEKEGTIRFSSFVGVIVKEKK